MMRDEILADCAKKFPCIYDKKDKGHKDRRILGNAWQKVVKKLKNSDFDMEVAKAKATFTNFKKCYQKKRATLRKGKKSGHGTKKVDKLMNVIKELDSDIDTLVQDIKSSCEQIDIMMNGNVINYSLFRQSIAAGEMDLKIITIQSSSNVENLTLSQIAR